MQRRLEIEMIPVMVVPTNPSLVARVELPMADCFPLQLVAKAANVSQCLQLAAEMTPRPRVILIADEGSEMPALDISRHLNTIRLGVGTITLSSHRDAGYPDRVMASGARRLVRLPLNFEVLRAAILDVAAWLPDSEAPPPTLGRVVVHSPKGGVGKSLIAANLAAIWAEAQPHHSLVLVDLDLQFGDTATLLDLTPERSIIDLLPVVNELDADALTRVLTSHSSGLRVMSCPLSPEQADMVQEDQVRSILTAMKAHFSTIVVDTSSMINGATLAAFEVADHILEVATLDVPSLRQTKVVLNLLERLGIPQEAVLLVLNKVNERLEIQPTEVEKLFSSYPIIAKLPDDLASVYDPVNSGTAVAIIAPEAPISRGFRQIAVGIGMGEGLAAPRQGWTSAR